MNVKREIGCGMWLVWLLLSIFAAEWLLLSAALKKTPDENLFLVVMVIVVVIIALGWAIVYFRVERREQ